MLPYIMFVSLSFFRVGHKDSQIAPAPHTPAHLSLRGSSFSQTNKFSLLMMHFFLLRPLSQQSSSIVAPTPCAQLSSPQKSPVAQPIVVQSPAPIGHWLVSSWQHDSDTEQHSCPPSKHDSLFVFEGRERRGGLVFLRGNSVMQFHQYHVPSSPRTIIFQKKKKTSSQTPFGT